jgi:hypothetical protein
LGVFIDGDAPSLAMGFRAGQEQKSARNKATDCFALIKVKLAGDHRQLGQHPPLKKVNPTLGNCPVATLLRRRSLAEVALQGIPTVSREMR